MRRHTDKLLIEMYELDTSNSETYYEKSVLIFDILKSKMVR